VTRCAITYTIKNEARILPDAIAYHRALGVERFYVFLDGTTDAMREWLGLQPDVRVQDTVRPETVVDPPSWIGWATENHAGWMDVRKMLNVWCANRQAHRDGFDWLALLDPDELIVPQGGLSGEVEIGDWLGAIPDRCDQVLMRNLDVLPTGDDGGRPFGGRHFINRLGWIEALWIWPRRALSRFIRSPETIAWYDHRFFRFALGRNNPRRLVDPRSGEEIPFGYFLSYSSQKPIGRPGRMMAFEPTLHYWRRKRGSLGRPRSLRSGNVLHFDLIDAAAFAAKFRQRVGQAEYEVKLFYPRWRLGKLATELDDAERVKFFDECLAVRDPERLAELIAAGTVVRHDRHVKMIGSG
jgi:Glycosyl transferase family 2